MDQETSFLGNYEVQNIAFQEANLLSIVTHYITSYYNKITYCISILSGKVYIQELITIAYQ